MTNQEREHTMTKHIVSYIEYGDGVDGRPRVMGAFNTFEEADKEIEKDMKRCANGNNYQYFGDWEVWRSEDEKWETGCVWNITSLEI